MGRNSSFEKFCVPRCGGLADEVFVDVVCPYDVKVIV